MRGCVGAGVWMHGCMDAWVCGCMDVRVHRCVCMGAYVYGRMVYVLVCGCISV